MIYILIGLFMKRFASIILTLTFVLCSYTHSRAQSELLTFAPGARAIGLGGSGVVEVYDPSAIFWNPAALSAINQNRALICIHEPFLLTYSAYSHFFPLYGTFAAAVAKTSAAENAFESLNFGWGLRLSSAWNLGVSLGALQSEREGWSIGGIGILYRPVSTRYISEGSQRNGFFSTLKSSLIDNRLTLGLSAQNIPLVVTDIAHEFRFGLSYKVTPWGPKLVSAYHIHQNEDTIHLGFESSPSSNIKLYIGMEDFDNDKLAFGFMARWQNLDLDLVYSVHSERLIISMSMRIGKAPRIVADDEVLAAKSAIKARDFRGALKSLRTALAYDNTHSEARKLYSWLAPKIRKENATVDSLLNVARMLEGQQWFISAAAHYINVLKIDPTNKVAEHSIAMIRPKVNIQTERWFHSAVKSFDRGDLERAKDVFESILIVRSDHEGSKEYLKKIYQIEKEKADTHFYTGLGFYSQKNFQRAVEEFEKVLALQPEHTEARDYLKEVQQELENRKKEIIRLMAEAERYRSSGQYLSASTLYRQVLARDPQNSLARERLQSLDNVVRKYTNRKYTEGERAFANGQFGKASKAFKAVLNLKPGDKRARSYLTKIENAKLDSAQVHYDSGMKYFEEEKWDEALVSFEAALAVHPGFAAAKDMRQKLIDAAGVQKVVERGMSEFLSGHYLRAMEIFGEALDVDPNNKEAMERREECQKKLNEEVEEYFNRGIQFYTAENYRAAVDEWSKALEINPQHKGSLEYKKKAEQRLEALNGLK